MLLLIILMFDVLTNLSMVLVSFCLSSDIVLLNNLEACTQEYVHNSLRKL
jgi:hypothetical protein